MTGVARAGTIFQQEFQNNGILAETMGKYGKHLSYLKDYEALMGLC